MIDGWILLIGLQLLSSRPTSLISGPSKSGKCSKFKLKSNHNNLDKSYSSLGRGTSMSYAPVVAHIPPCFIAVRAAARNKQPSKKTQAQNPATITTNGFGGEKKDPVWQCVQNCGACCKLDKGPSFPSPEEIFDDPSDVQLYESLIGPDGWCINYEKSTRKCSIYAERPYFCRVEPEVFDLLYGISKTKFNKEACSCCTDTIKAVYGIDSEELQTFNRAVWTDISE